jgi:hypothetical protein
MIPRLADAGVRTTLPWRTATPTCPSPHHTFVSVCAGLDDRPIDSSSYSLSDRRQKENTRIRTLDANHRERSAERTR